MIQSKKLIKDSSYYMVTETFHNDDKIPDYNYEKVKVISIELYKNGMFKSAKLKSEKHTFEFTHFSYAKYFFETLGKTKAYIKASKIEWCEGLIDYWQEQLERVKK